MTRTMPMATFIRDYASVLDQIEEAGEDVTLERRSGRRSFVLASLDRVSDDRHAISAVTQMLSTVLAENDVADMLTSGLADTYPWVEFLPPKERQRFGTELISTLRACASIGRFAGYENFVSSWATTAEIWSDPDLARALSHPVDVPDATAVLEPATA